MAGREFGQRTSSRTDEPVMSDSNKAQKDRPCPMCKGTLKTVKGNDCTFCKKGGGKGNQTK